MAKTKSTKTGEYKVEQLVIAPPNMELAEFLITGTTPMLQHRFGSRPLNDIRKAQEAGSTTRKGSKKEKRDFDLDFKESAHVSMEGWHGIPAAAFRNACVSACRLCGFKMTVAKLSVFVKPNGFAEDGTPLVKIIKGGTPQKHIAAVRLPNGTITLASRAMYREGWQAKVTVEFDRDQFSLSDVTNLMIRVGRQIGIGEGRHDSRKSTGLGLGCFDLEERNDLNEK